MAWLTNLLARLAGKKIAKELELMEGKMEDSKKWYQSKSKWTAVVTVIIGLYDLIGANLAPVIGWTLPQIPAWVLTILGAMGIYSRVTAEKKIG
jgi:membrane protein YqaA with SNARE-associated domain